MLLHLLPFLKFLVNMKKIKSSGSIRKYHRCPGRYTLFFLYFLLLILFPRCSDDDLTPEIETNDPNEIMIDDADFSPTDWTDETHGKYAIPDFNKVFDNTEVKRIGIVLTEARWLAMLNNMTNLYGSFGSRGEGGANPGGGIPGNEEDPVFVPADIFYNGKQKEEG